MNETSRKILEDSATDEALNITHYDKEIDLHLRKIEELRGMLETSKRIHSDLLKTLGSEREDCKSE